MMCPYGSYTGSLCQDNGKQYRKDYHSIICEKVPIVSTGCKIVTVLQVFAYKAQINLLAVSPLFCVYYSILYKGNAI